MKSVYGTWCCDCGRRGPMFCEDCKVFRRLLASLHARTIDRSPEVEAERSRRVEIYREMAERGEELVLRAALHVGGPP